MLGKTHPRCCDRESNCPKPATAFSVAEFKHIVKQLTAERQANSRCVSGVGNLRSEQDRDLFAQSFEQISERARAQGRFGKEGMVLQL